MKASVSLFAVAVLSMVLTASPNFFAAQPPAAPERQPEMAAALEHLRAAQHALESASHDKGGHRVKALEHVRQAIAEVEAGIRYDNTHTSKGERH
jgi:hypothetical protein